MNALVVRLSPKDEIELGQEIERLFHLQDSPLSHDKKALFVNELALTGMPFKALIRGIRDLVDKPLKQIKLSEVKESIKKYVQLKDGFAPCKICSCTGSVTMQNEAKYTFAYPCTCEKGQHIAEAQELKQWNGKRNMLSRQHGIMTLIQPNPDALNIPPADDDELVGVAAGEKVNWND